MALGLFRQRIGLALCLACALCVTRGEAIAAPKLQANVNDARQALQAGEDFERTRRWIDAIEHYEASIKKWPNDRDLSYGLRRSKIHFGIERRYSDSSFRTNMLTISRHEALSLFDEVINKIKSHFVDPLSSTSFVAHGTESLYIALANEKFLEHHLPGRRAAIQSGISRLRETLRTQYWNKPLNSSSSAHQTVSEVAGLAEAQLGLNSTAVVMEYVFGGCHALDDYSNCLTPDRLSDLYDNIDGEFVGLGIEMKAEAGRGMSLVNVLPESPAAEGGLLIGDYIVGIDGHDCRNMSTDEAAGRLKGKPGSRVRLDVSGLTAADRRTVTVVRRAVQVKSIPIAKIVDESRGIGYIQMTGFQKSSPVGDTGTARSDLGSTRQPRRTADRGRRSARPFYRQRSSGLDEGTHGRSEHVVLGSPSAKVERPARAADRREQRQRQRDRRRCREGSSTWCDCRPQNLRQVVGTEHLSNSAQRRLATDDREVLLAGWQDAWKDWRETGCRSRVARPCRAASRPHGQFARRRSRHPQGARRGPRAS